MAVPAYKNAKSAEQAALVRLAHHAGYLAESAYGLTYVPVPDLRAKLGGTSWIGVDEFARVYYDPAEIVKHSAMRNALTFMHEDWHPLRCHAERARTFWASVASDPVLGAIVANMDEASRHKCWNLAGDAEINDDLHAQFSGEPDASDFFDNCILPSALREKFGISTPDGASAEQFARAMLETQDTQDGQDAMDGAEGDCGGGSGADGQPQEWEAGDPGDDEGEGEGDPQDAQDGKPGGKAPKPAGKDATAMEIMRIEVAKAIRQAQGAGTMSGGMMRWAEEKLTPPKVRWERELRAKTRRALTFISGHDDFTFARPSHLRVPGAVLPGTHSPELNIDVLLDDSGSMGDGPGSRLARAVTEIENAGKVATHTRFTACDAAINSKRAKFEDRAKNVMSKFTGGGGTDLRVGFAHIATLKPKPNLIICVTDGDTPWPDAKPKRCEVIVVLVDANDYARERVPKWASVVEVND